MDAFSATRRLQPGDRHRQAARPRRRAGPRGGHRPRRASTCSTPTASTTGSTSTAQRVAIQGFGNVGSWMARELPRPRAPRSSPCPTSRRRSSTTDGPRRRRPGRARRRAARSVDSRRRAATSSPTRSCSTLDCDVLVPAALGEVITEDNADAGAGAGRARGGQLPDHPERRQDPRATAASTVIPDILANAGGVTGSYFEWTQNIQQFTVEGGAVQRRAARQDAGRLPVHPGVRRGAPGCRCARPPSPSASSGSPPPCRLRGYI